MVNSADLLPLPTSRASNFIYISTSYVPSAKLAAGGDGNVVGMEFAEVLL
jgi:hypothetical protein